MIKLNWFWPFKRRSNSNGTDVATECLDNIEHGVNESAVQLAADTSSNGHEIAKNSYELIRGELVAEYSEEAVLAAEAYLAKQDNVRNTTSYLRSILKNNWHQAELNKLHANRAKSCWQEFKRLPIDEQKKCFMDLQQLIRSQAALIPVQLSRYGEQILYPGRVIIKDSGSPQYQGYLYWCWLHRVNLFSDPESVECKFFELFQAIKPMVKSDIQTNANRAAPALGVKKQIMEIHQPYFKMQEADPKFAELHKFAKFKIYNQIKSQVSESSELIQRLPIELQHQSKVIIAGNARPYGVAYLYWLYLNPESTDYVTRNKRSLAMFALFEVLKHRNKPETINIRKNGDIYIGTSTLKWRYEK